MRVLVIGSGAREHALVWKLAQSPRVNHIFAAPGNPGMLPYAECRSIGINQFTELADFVEHNRVDLTVIGPEVPLVEGIVNVFQRRDLPTFGPCLAGAALEGSKAFAKTLMVKAGIPTAQYRSFTNYKEAQAYLEEHGAPVVIKADGNAAGKGAIIADDMATARDTLKQMMVDHVFGAAGDTVVIEEYLQGIEISSTAICRGFDFLPLLLTQDHKRALDNDEGLNTGGMGAFTPLPFVSWEQEQQIRQQIIAPTLQALVKRGILFTGVLYSNIMLTERGPVVLEHNIRFGDPEAQALILLLRRDLVDVLEYTEGVQVDSSDLWHPGYAVSLTLASGGYPGKYRTGFPITGIEEAERLEGVQVFHAGTALKQRQLVTMGGRVLSVAARGATLEQAVQKVYEAAAMISFEGMHYRKDIAHRGLRVS
ncbi:MAG TPA: phosphoribosylamine--glycine ligase [Ktedonobacteraceae bacterium]|nr:phosphoribosylamine--glycine ligase [Ktedonobacteraceae bacterium]